MTDDRRHPSRPSGPKGRRVAIAAAAASALVLAGGIAVAGAESGPAGPQVTDSTLAPTTSAPVVDTTESTETTLGDTTTTEASPDQEATEAPENGLTGTEHPDNHGKDVSEAAQDHSHDQEAGNHGAYVSGVARGDGTTTSTSAPSAAADASGGHGRSGR
jgi:hypothetical protein